MSDRYKHLKIVPGPRKTTTCKHCSQSDLIWNQIDDGSWRLFTKSGILHECLRNLRVKQVVSD